MHDVTENAIGQFSKLIAELEDMDGVSLAEPREVGGGCMVFAVTLNDGRLLIATEAFRQEYNGKMEWFTEPSLPESTSGPWYVTAYPSEQVWIDGDDSDFEPKVEISENLPQLVKGKVANVFNPGDRVHAIYPNESWGSGIVVSDDANRHDFKTDHTGRVLGVGQTKPVIVRREDGELGHFYHNQIRPDGD